MKVTQHIEQAKGNTLFSFEILPPLKGETVQHIYDTIDNLIEYKPSFIDVTYHREEFVYIERENGLLEKKIVRKRPGTVGICAVIQNKYKVDAIPHILCGGFDKEDTENFLIDLDFLGIDNVLALRGDAIKNETYFKPEKNGHHYAHELVSQINELNQGKYLDDYLENNYPTHFCVGVAAYPEKHTEAANLNQDIHYLKQKIAAGADYVVTQMFFDNSAYFKFVDQCRAAGITIPIIPGLKPIAAKSQLSMIPHRFKVDLPQELINEILKCKNNTDVKKVGNDWCIQQSKELKQKGVPALHYYSMGKSDNIKAVVKEVF